MWLAPAIPNSLLNVGWSYNCYNLFFLIWTILLSGHRMSAHVWSGALDPHPPPPNRHTHSTGSSPSCFCLGPGDTIPCLAAQSLSPSCLQNCWAPPHPFPVTPSSPSEPLDLCVPRFSSFKAWHGRSSLECSSLSLLLILSFCFLYYSHHSWIFFLSVCCLSFSILSY